MHTDTINLSACSDQACKYPLVVSPSVITVTYEVTQTVPGEQGYTVRRSVQAVSDITWSESRNALYGAMPAQSSDPSNVIVIDPVTETVSDSVAVDFDPSLLALSDDESMLYVCERNGDAIRRFATEPLEQDILISLGTDPFSPRAYVVTQSSNDTPYVEVFDLVTRERIGEAMLPRFHSTRERLALSAMA